MNYSDSLDNYVNEFVFYGRRLNLHSAELFSTKGAAVKGVLNLQLCMVIRLLVGSH